MPIPLPPISDHSALDQAKDITAAIQAIVTSFALLAGGLWAWLKFGWQLERYAHIESEAQIEFIGQHKGEWIAEIRAVLVNKGKVEHRIANLEFDLAAVFSDDNLKCDPRRWGGQVQFDHE